MCDIFVIYDMVYDVFVIYDVCNIFVKSVICFVCGATSGVSQG